MFFLIDFSIVLINFEVLNFIFNKIRKINVNEIFIKIQNQIQSNQLISFEDIKIKMLVFCKIIGHSIRFCNFGDLNLAKYFLRSESLSCFFDSLAYCILKYGEGKKTFLNKKVIYDKAKLIALSCKKSYNTPITINDISSIEKYFDFNLIIFSFSNNPLNRVNTIYKSKIIHKKTVFLLLHMECFYPLKNPKYLINKSGHESSRNTDYCVICFQFVKKINLHKCNEFCTICKTIECPKFESDKKYKTCSDCNRTFPSSTCFNFHKTNGTCSRQKICSKCCSKFKFNSHICSVSICSVCKTQYKNDGLSEHICSITPSILKSKNKNKNTIRCYFDIEAYLDQNSMFVPTILICQTVCNFCDSQNKKCFFHSFESIFETDSDKSCVLKFIYFLLELEQNNRKSLIIVVAHNLGGYDGLLIYNELLDNFSGSIFSSEPIKNGNKLITFSISDNITFKDTLKYIPASLKKLPAMFDCEKNLKKGFFPYKFYSKNNLKYIGEIPHKKYFELENCTQNELKDFNVFYSNKLRQSYNIHEECITYCRNDVEILRISIEKFRKNTIKSLIVDPLVDACTIASTCFNIFLQNFKDKSINLVAIDRYTRARYSKEGLTWIQIQQLNFKTKIYHGGDFKGERRIKLQNGQVIFADGIEPKSKTIFQYYGCYFHGCPDCGYTKSLRNGIPGLQYYLKTINTELNIKKKFNLVSVWSHEIQQKRNTDSEFNTLWESLYKKNSFEFRIQPGDSLFGGRTNAFRLLVLEKELKQNNASIKYVDFMSLYPSVMKQNPFPVGTPKITLKKDVPPINKFIEDGQEKYFGIIKIRILPPSDLLFPVLPISINKKLMFPLCFCCAKNESYEDCNHSNLERSWVGTYASVELFDAINHGYSILEIFEIWSFEKSETLFAKYIDYFLKQKIEASGFPVNVKTQEEKEKYIFEIAQKEGINLNISDIKKNPSKRTQAKLSLNNLWGKFAQNPDKIHTKICSEYSEFIDFVFDDEKIISSVHLSDTKAVLDYRVQNESIQPGKWTNVVIAAFTTAYARLKLLNAMRIVGDRLLYVDTDSLIFISSKDDIDPPLGSSLGQLTDEITPEFGVGSKGISFVSTGPKSYCLVIKDKKDIKSFITRCKGFTISNETKSKICFKSMRALVEGSVDSIQIDSKRFQPQKYGGVKLSEITKKFQKTYSKRKIIDEFKTRPYGYKL